MLAFLFSWTAPKSSSSIQSMDGASIRSNRSVHGINFGLSVLCFYFKTGFIYSHNILFFFSFFSKINLKFYIQKAYFDFPDLQTQTVTFSAEHYMPLQVEILQTPAFWNVQTAFVRLLQESRRVRRWEGIRSAAALPGRGPGDQTRAAGLGRRAPDEGRWFDSLWKADVLQTHMVYFLLSFHIHCFPFLWPHYFIKCCLKFFIRMMLLINLNLFSQFIIAINFNHIVKKFWFTNVKKHSKTANHLRPALKEQRAEFRVNKRTAGLTCFGPATPG